MRFTFYAAWDDVQVVQRREKWAKSTSDRNKLWKKAHERNAKRIHNAIVGLEGLWVKAGQYLSTRADVLPDPYIEVLRLLQDSLPPRSIKEVCEKSSLLSSCVAIAQHKFPYQFNLIPFSSLCLLFDFCAVMNIVLIILRERVQRSLGHQNRH